MTSTGRLMRLASAGALMVAATTIGSAVTDARSSIVASPFSFEVYDSDDGSTPNLSQDGKFLYSSFVGRPMRVDIARGTSEVTGGFGDGVLSGPVSFVDTGTGSQFTRLLRSGASTSIDRLPWVAPGSSVLAADAFGRYVIPDAEPGTVHDTRTGLVWQPWSTFSRVRPAGPNSLSADGNVALFLEQSLRCCPPAFSTFNRSTGKTSFVELQLTTETTEAALSANARYVVIPAGSSFVRADLVTDTKQFVSFDGTPGVDPGTPTQIAVGNDGQVFWVSGDHAYRWLDATDTIEQIDVSPDGESADAPVRTLRVTADGSRIVFTSAATNLDPSWGCCGTDNEYTYVGTARPATGYVRAPSPLDATGIHPKMADVSWGPSSTAGVTSYALLRNGVEIAQTVGTALSLTGLPSGNSYFQAQALAPSTGDDGGIRRSVRTAPAKVKTDYDATRPTVPTDLTAAFNPRESTFDLGWGASADNSNVVRYAVYDKNILVTMVDDPSVRLNLPSGNTHYFQVRAIDLNGNQSVKTTPVFIEN